MPEKKIPAIKRLHSKLIVFTVSLTLLFDMLVSSVLGRSVDYPALVVFAILFFGLGWSLGVGEKTK